VHHGGRKTDDALSDGSTAGNEFQWQHRSDDLDSGPPDGGELVLRFLAMGEVAVDSVAVDQSCHPLNVGIGLDDSGLHQ
jgi:hypothetical protein